MKTLLAIVAVVAVAGLAGPALAQSPPSPPPDKGLGLGTAAKTPAASHNPNVLAGPGGTGLFTPGKASPPSGVQPGNGTATSNTTRGGGKK